MESCGDRASAPSCHFRFSIADFLMNCNIWSPICSLRLINQFQISHRLEPSVLSMADRSATCLQSSRRFGPARCSKPRGLVYTRLLPVSRTNWATRNSLWISKNVRAKHRVRRFKRRASREEKMWRKARSQVRRS